MTNILLVVFNGCLVIVTWRLVVVGWRQAKHLDETMKATKDAADAAKEANTLTREALIADKRAFLFPDTFDQVYDAPDSVGLYNWHLRPRWKNGGGTPTKNLRLLTECEVRNSLLPTGYIFNTAKSPAIGFLAPKSNMFGGQAPPGIGITPQDIVDAQNGRKFIYLWGWMKYFDVFPNTPEHTTHFCWLILISGDPFKFVPNTEGRPPTPGTLSFSLLQHTEGNYAD